MFVYSLKKYLTLSMTTNQTTSAVLLRTLTEKSKLGFGKHSDIQIFKLLENNSGRSYLMYIYYNSSMISFCDSILDSIKIRKEDRIQKPGIDRKLYDTKMKSIHKQSFAKHGSKVIIIRRTIAKNKLILHAKRSYLSRSELRDLNRKK